ncbi:glycosyl transferase family 2 [Haladaptatus sp. GCM10025707]|uniref:glycosyl transferase family 2 n=1 Tax=unclassified Haladaptatus TaxID=2622732 RepID=UPI0023E8B0A9|nr:MULTISPECIES: glycosyl transferase family 2 [unclassified Haladaptatus]
MEYVQERVTTLHDLTGHVPDAPTDRAAVVVPMTEREYAGLAAERVLSTLERVGPARVVVPLRASADRVGDFCDWFDAFELDVDLLWCTGPGLGDRLAEAGLSGPMGKGRDVWLALGIAAQEEYVVVHDADAKTYAASHVPRLLAPLAGEYEFTKGYYARVENNQLYGRLARLFVAPLLRALAAEHDAPILDYLTAFRYPLAGEFAATSKLARHLRPQRQWGLELSTLGDAFGAVGFTGSAQVDLGKHEHDHRAVSGPTGLSDMSEGVGQALFQVLADFDVKPDYDALPGQYRETALQFVRQYAADAAFNGLDYDREAERRQVGVYQQAIEPLTDDMRLPSWDESSLAPDEVWHASRTDLEAAMDDH